MRMRKRFTTAHAVFVLLCCCCTGCVSQDKVWPIENGQVNILRNEDRYYVFRRYVFDLAILKEACRQWQTTSTDQKLEWVRKCGWSVNDPEYTDGVLEAAVLRHAQAVSPPHQANLIEALWLDSSWRFFYVKESGDVLVRRCVNPADREIIRQFFWPAWSAQGPYSPGDVAIAYDLEQEVPLVALRVLNKMPASNNVLIVRWAGHDYPAVRSKPYLVVVPGFGPVAKVVLPAESETGTVDVVGVATAAVLPQKRVVIENAALDFRIEFIPPLLRVSQDEKCR